MRVPSLFTALLLSAGLWAQLPFSFSGSAGGDCVPQIHNEPWPGGSSPADLTGSVRFDWSATNSTNAPVPLEVRVYRDQYGGGPNPIPENSEFFFTVTATANGTSSGTVFWTCPISSFEELRAHSVRVSGPSGTCTAFSMTVGYVVPAFGNDAEPNDSPGGQPLSTVNIDYDGHLRTNYATDDDWYRIQLPAQGKLLITIQSETPGSTPATMEAHLSYTTSTPINTWSGSSGTDHVPNTNVFEQTCAGNANGGIYYLRIRATGACDVSYRMTLTLVAPAFTNDTEPNNSTGQAIVLPETQTAQGQLYFQHGDNVDIYRADLSSDGVMHIAIEAEQAGTSTTGTLQVILFTSNSTVLQTWNVPVGANSFPISTVLSMTCRGNTSPYYLQLIASDCGTSYQFSYSMTPPLFAQDPEPNNSTSQSIPLPETQTADGHLNFYFGDNLDIYRLNLTTDGVLHVAFEAEHADASTAETIQIYLSNSVGTILKTWTAPVGANSIAVSSIHDMTCLGTVIPYYLSVASSVCGASYRMSYTMTPPLFANDVEPNGSVGQAIVLPPSTQTTGRLNFNAGENSDYYRINMPTDGVLNVTIEAEHAGLSTIETVAAYISVSTGTTLASWNASVGASSSPTSTSFSLSCRGTNNPYYLTLISNVCGVSYRVSWTVTAPVYANDPEPNNSSPGTPMDLNAGEQQGHIGFYNLGDPDYYAFTHPGGPWSVTVSAEHANAGDGTLTMRVFDNPGNLYGTFTVPVGGSSTPLTNTFTIPSLPVGSIYRLIFTEVTCGVSYRIHCYDDDNDGTCNAFDLCAGGPEPGTPCDDGTACTTGDVIDANCICVGTPVTVDDGDPCTLDSCDPINGVSHIFQDADNDGTCDANDLCPGGPEPGTACDDGNACTTGDVIDANCACVGTAVNADDGDPCTLDSCDPINGPSHIFQDADFDGTCDANDLCPNDPDKIAPGNCGCGNPEPGATCDDGNALTINDVIQGNCSCAGTLLGNDCLGVPGGPALPGTPCNDNSACTSNDVYQPNCTCAGTPVNIDDNDACTIDSCDPILGVIHTPVNSDDGNACTIDTCDPILGVIHTPVNSDDGDPCTLDSCDPINGPSHIFQDADNDGTCDANDLCAGGPEPGTLCDDLDAGTENDVIGTNCQCAGTPIGGGCVLNALTLYIDGDGLSNVGWTLYVQGTSTVAASGGHVYPAGSNQEAICVADGCYHLVVTDDGGDGIAGGGYLLRITNGPRVIDDRSNFSSGSVSAIMNNGGFCVPMGNDRLISQSCDRMELRRNVNGLCNDRLTADNTPNGTSGNVYQFWIFDPNGSLSLRYPPNGPGSNQVSMANLPSLVEGTMYNVRVRTRISPGVWREWGSTCRMKIDNTLGQCAAAFLVDDPSNANHSCGKSIILPVSNSTGAANRVVAMPVTRYNNNCVNAKANKYQFRFRIPAENVVIVLNSNNNFTHLLTSGGFEACRTYEVEVRASFNGGSTWCRGGADPYGDLTPWGDICEVYTDGCGSGELHLAAAGTNDGLRMYPNPNRGDQLFLSLDEIQEGVETVSVDIYDAFGKRVSARTITVNDGFINTVLELNGELASGLYVVNITAGNAVYTERLVIQP
ncbi:MAG: T9SS type A sorting domain-containing protein [Flavobacteriales bacterium]|nr:T9SS type A sorting domain-containing protein [Flavobacteriales bacterium]